MGTHGFPPNRYGYPGEFDNLNAGALHPFFKRKDRPGFSEQKKIKLFRDYQHGKTVTLNPDDFVNYNSQLWPKEEYEHYMLEKANKETYQMSLIEPLYKEGHSVLTISNRTNIDIGRVLFLTNKLKRNGTS